MSDQRIAGVTLEQYARLCAAMADTGEDEARQLEIAAAAGVSADAWRQARDGFTAKMQDPADMGKTAGAFMPLYQAAQAEARGGGPPCSLELYAKISTAYSYEQDADGNQVPPEQIFARHGISAAKWNEYTGYWTPKVNDPADPAAAEFRTLVQAESDAIFGIHRNAAGSVVDPDDEDEGPADRAAARAALANARRPVDGNPTAASPGAGPVTPRASAAAPASPPAAAAPPPPPLAKAAPVATPTPAAPTPVAPTTAPAGDSVHPAGSQTPAAPRPSASSSAAASSAPAPGASTSDEKLMAALIHLAVVIGFAGFAPLVIWLINKDGKNDYLAFRAKQAAIVQFGALAALVFISVITCGFGTLLLLPWFAFEVYLAWQAYEGHRPGYPGLPDFEG